MSITFEEIPAGYRRPGTYIESDPSLATKGAQAFPLRGLILAQRLPGGTISTSDPTRITSAEQAATFAGKGSPGALMAEAWFSVNQTTEVDLCLVADAAGATDKSVTLTLGGTATGGTFVVYVGGERYPVSAAGTPVLIAARIAAAVAADTDSPALAAVDASNTSMVTFVSKVPGYSAGYWNVEHSLQVDEARPYGLTVAIVATDGTLEPTTTLSTAIASWGDVQYDVIANQFQFDAQQELIAAEMATRDDALTGTAGIAFSCVTGPASSLTTLGNGLNSQFLSVTGLKRFNGIAYKRAGAIAGLVALHGSVDPARPFQSLQLPGKYTPEAAGYGRLSNAERNLLLHDGISTVNYDVNDVPRIERLITTYQTNDAGAASVAYLDVNLVLLISYFRKAWTARVSERFPRHKLAPDGGTPPAPGSKIVTPKSYKAQAVAFYAELVTKGLVTDEAGFAANSTFEINASDPNRMDVILAPDFINQLRVNATLLQFRL